MNELGLPVEDDSKVVRWLCLAMVEMETANTISMNTIN